MDFFSGEELDGNISAIVIETGEKNATFSQGGFEIVLNSNLNYLENKFRIVIFANTSNKTGYSNLELGYGNFAQQTQSCVNKKYYFEGLALDENGNPINGKINVFVENEKNSTEFYNGEWSIEISACLIPGEIYTFKFLIESNESKGFFSIKQVGKF
ncbi:MAG: hypothetical protein QXP77_01475 [Candidatus Aenigmatarchaeota archaeon]